MENLTSKGWVNMFAAVGDLPNEIGDITDNHLVIVIDLDGQGVLAERSEIVAGTNGERVTFEYAGKKHYLNAGVIRPFADKTERAKAMVEVLKDPTKAQAYLQRLLRKVERAQGQGT